jgi:hypothetical protein
MEEIIHNEVLERNLTVTVERFYQQLRRLEESIQQKRPGQRHGVIFQHENARPQTSNMTKTDIQELDWDILPHQAYSSDLALSDYHLFRSLSNSLCGVSFNNGAELQNWLDVFFMAKPAYFFKRRMKNLPECWEAIMNNGGEYINIDCLIICVKNKLFVSARNPHERMHQPNTTWR